MKFLLSFKQKLIQSLTETGVRYLKKKRVIDVSFYSSIKKNEEQPNDTNEIRKAHFNEVLSDSNKAFREAKNISSRLRRFQKQMSVNSQ